MELNELNMVGPLHENYRRGQKEKFISSLLYKYRMQQN